MIALSAADAVSYGPLVVAVPIAMVAGLASFLSPCCLPLVPGYLAYVSGAAGGDASTADDGGQPPPAGATSSATITAPRTRSRSTAVTGTVLFVLGFAAVFTSYGALFGTVGASLARHMDVVTLILGALTIVMGLAFAGALPRVGWLGRTVRIGYRPRVGLAGAPALGVMFGIGWTPCIGPTLAAVLALATTTQGAARGALLSFAYSVGLGVPFLCASIGLNRAFTAFGFARRHARLIMRMGGALLVVLGILEVSGLWTALMAQFQSVVAAWQAPL